MNTPQYTWGDLTTHLINGQDLEARATTWAMDQVMNGGATPVQLAGFLVALRAKGETVAEMTGLAQAMMDHAVTYPDLAFSTNAVDIVGSGGDRMHTVNISTMASLVIAGTGTAVVKHGNRASSSSSGSADVLEALGIPLNHVPERVAQIGAKVGITFCFAQTFHPSMRYAATARKELNVPTAFNYLGPITNPGQPRATAVGVADMRMAPLIAGVFAGRGTQALVFRGALGLDELAAIGPADIWSVDRSTVTHEVLDPVQDLGLSPIDVADLRGASAEFNAQVARDFLAGKPGPVRETVLLNAAAALVASGTEPETQSGTLAERLRGGYAVAQRAVDDGRALGILDAWRVEASK